MDGKKLEEKILAKSKDGKIPCAVCFKIADDLGIPKKEITKVLNEMKIKISSVSWVVLSEISIEISDYTD